MLIINILFSFLIFFVRWNTAKSFLVVDIKSVKTRTYTVFCEFFRYSPVTNYAFMLTLFVLARSYYKSIDVRFCGPSPTIMIHWTNSLLVRRAKTLRPTSVRFCSQNWSFVMLLSVGFASPYGPWGELNSSSARIN